MTKMLVGCVLGLAVGNWLIGYQQQPDRTWKITWNVTSDTPPPAAPPTTAPKI
jgi:hypothetical protein